MAQVMTILNDGPRIQDVDDVKIWKTILQARRPSFMLSSLYHQVNDVLSGPSNLALADRYPQT